MPALENLTICLGEKKATRETLDSEWKMWGGKALTSRMIAERVPPSCNPLGPDNILVIATGLLAGSGASSSNRISIGGKSPLTGGIKEANSGGLAGFALSQLGLRSLILEGQSDEWVILSIDQNGVSFLPGRNLVEKDIFTTTEFLREQFGQKCAVLSIGPAGERQYKSACIGISDLDGIPARHAARGGLGSVMGSKKIKAIVLDYSGAEKTISNRDARLSSAVKRFTKALLNHPTSGKVLPKYGTAIIVDSMQALGGLPTRNYSEGTFENANQINGEALYKFIESRGGKPTHACMPGCVIRCSNVIPDQDGGELNRALEYETIVLLGSNCGIGDLETICRLNRACDAIGLDTIETGAAIGVAMEGGMLPFGDGERALELMTEITLRTPLGELIANGADETGHALSVKRIPTVRGQAMAAYDPRTIKGTGVTYATSPMGADHTAGNVLPGMKLPSGITPDCSSKEYQIEMSRYVQLSAAMFDYMGLCWFTKPPIFDDFSLVLDILNAYLDETWTVDDIFKMSEVVIQMELEFNRKAGVSEQNDLPEFFRTEPLPPNGYVFDLDPHMLQKIHQGTPSLAPIQGFATSLNKQSR